MNKTINHIKVYLNELYAQLHAYKSYLPSNHWLITQKENEIKQFETEIIILEIEEIEGN